MSAFGKTFAQVSAVILGVGFWLFVAFIVWALFDLGYFL